MSVFWQKGVRHHKINVDFLCEYISCPSVYWFFLHELREMLQFYINYATDDKFTSEDNTFTENFIKTVLQKYPELVGIDVKTKYDRIIYFIKNSARKV
jgi:hypothetical protein